MRWVDNVITSGWSLLRLWWWLNQFHCCCSFFLFHPGGYETELILSHPHGRWDFFLFSFSAIQNALGVALVYCACALFLLPRSALALSLASIVSRDSCRFHARGWWTLCLSPLPRLSVVGRLSGAAAVAHRFPPALIAVAFKPPPKSFSTNKEKKETIEFENPKSFFFFFQILSRCRDTKKFVETFLYKFPGWQITLISSSSSISFVSIQQRSSCPGCLETFVFLLLASIVVN